MSKVIPVNGMLLVEPYDKRIKKTDHENPFSNVVVSNNLGTVKYSSSEDFAAGSRVYFGGQHERIVVEGVEVLSMRTDNVIATVKD